MSSMLEEPIVARSFYLDFPKLSGFALTGVSGLDVELDVVSISTNAKNGKQVHQKTVGGNLKTPDITVTRIAPRDVSGDNLWTWFTDIRDKGMKDAVFGRQDGSIVLYATDGTEVGRYNIFGCWPSKISTDALSTDSNESLKETITFATERIQRVK
jgi:phage tail-like protein